MQIGIHEYGAQVNIDLYECQAGAHELGGLVGLHDCRNRSCECGVQVPYYSANVELLSLMQRVMVLAPDLAKYE